MKRSLLSAVAVVGMMAAMSQTPADASTHRHYARGHSVRAATRSANRHAGTAKDIAPDSRQSATGGPPGGLPGHE